MSLTILQQHLGAPAARKVMELAGGERLHVPGLLRNAGRLRVRFGDDLAVALVEHFGDSRPSIPRISISPPLDDAEVKRLTLAGKSATHIARRLGCTVRAVHKARKRITSGAARYHMGRTRNPFRRKKSPRFWDLELLEAQRVEPTAKAMMMASTSAVVPIEQPLLPGIE